MISLPSVAFSTATFSEMTGAGSVNCANLHVYGNVLYRPRARGKKIALFIRRSKKGLQKKSVAKKGALADSYKIKGGKKLLQKRK